MSVAAGQPGELASSPRKNAAMRSRFARVTVRFLLSASATARPTTKIAETNAKEKSTLLLVSKIFVLRTKPSALKIASLARTPKDRVKNMSE